MHWSSVPGLMSEVPDWVRLEAERILRELNDEARASGLLPERCHIVWDLGNDTTDTATVAGAGRRDEGEEDGE